MADEEFPKILRPMKWHGVEFIQLWSGDDILADCPFCGKRKGFLANKETGKWICHTKPSICGRSGNVPSFLSQLHKFYLAQTTPAMYSRLSKARGGIPAEVFKKREIAWNSHTNRWMIPVYTERGTVQDIRTWTRSGKLMGTAGCKSGMWNVDTLATCPTGTKVFICEGEWDGIVWDYVLTKAKYKRFCVVAIPGAKVFKLEWYEAFRKMHVIVMGDNDSDGDRMAAKIYEGISDKASSLKYLNWPPNYRDKWDVRDQIIEYRNNGMTARKAVENIMGMVSHRHRAMPFKGQEDSEAAKTGERAKRARPKSNPTFQETLEVYKKHLKMTKDLTMALTALYAVHISSRWPDIPLWMHLVGAPSAGKTALLMSLFTTPDTVFESSVSGPQLISGFSGKKDPSLIPKLIGKCGVFKDWTEMISDNPSKMEDVNKILRGAYDGHAKRDFGNGESREYHGTFNLITGVTNKINVFSDATVGERFLKFQLPRPPKKVIDEILMMAMYGVSEERDRNAALQEAACKFLDRDEEMPSVRTAIDMSYLERCRSMAHLIARLRATVEWKGYGWDRELAVKPDPELPTRLAKQFTKFGLAVMVVLGKKKMDDECWSLVERVAFNTGHGFNLDVIAAMMKDNDGRYCFVEDLCQTCSMPRTTMDRRLEDMRIMSIVTKTPHRLAKHGRPQVAYSVTPSIKMYWRDVNPTDFHLREAIHARKLN